MRFFLSVSRLLFIITTFIFIPCTIAAKDFVLVIDPGHGGKDPGALGTYSKEKNINLNVALKVGELVRRNCPDVKVVFTRKTDVFVQLDDRAEIANKAKADLFISIHTNALPKGRQISGSETYSLGMARAGENLDVAKRENSVILYEKDYQKRYAGFNPNSAESYIIFDFMQDQYMKQSAELANSIQKYYAQAGRPNKGVHQAGFLVLRKTSMPSVLTELGFITTPHDEQYLNSAKGTDQLARSIYNGFVEYKNRQQRHKSPILDYADDKQVQQEEAENTREAEETRKKEQASQQKADGQTEKAEEKSDIPVIEQEEPQPAEKDKPEEATPSVVEKSAEAKPEKQTQKIEKEKEQIKKEGQENKTESKEITYKIQILTASRMLRSDAQQFKGLKGVDHFKEKNIYKYTYGSTSSYSSISQTRKEILEKFPDCFIVAFQGKDRITVQEALQLQKK